MAAMMNMMGRGMGETGQTGAAPKMPDGLQMPNEEETKKIMDDVMKMMQGME